MYNGLFDFDGDEDEDEDFDDLYLEMDFVNDDDDDDYDYDDDYDDDDDDDDYDDDDDDYDDDDDDDDDDLTYSVTTTTPTIYFHLTYTDEVVEVDDEIDDEVVEVDDEIDDEVVEVDDEIDDEVVEVDDEIDDKIQKINEADYPNKRRYLAAYALAYTLTECYSDSDLREKACCEFIVNKSDTILAANYLTYDYGFIYSQAIKDNFKLPVTIPDEDEKREFEFKHILEKITRVNIPLAFEVWEWCLEQFLPYSQYDAYSQENLTTSIFLNLLFFSDEFKIAIVEYLGENPDFRKTVICGDENALDGVVRLMELSLQKKLLDIAHILFLDALALTNGKWRLVNKLMSSAIDSAKNYKELETIEFVEQEFFPLIKAYPDGMIQDEFPLWEKNIAEYKIYVERKCKQYAYTRSNSWRNKFPDSKKYGLDPVNYNSEKEYLDVEKNKKALLELNHPKIKEDKNIYIYCGVQFNSSSPYAFRTTDTSIKIGDTVIVPLSEEQIETKGTVVSVGQYTRIAVPYPLEQTKFILRKIEP